MNVERATEDELADVIGIDAAVTGTPRTALLTDAVRQRQCYVARKGWDVVGFALLSRHFFGEYLIELVVVHPAHRRKGVASALMRHIEKIVPTEKLFTSTNVGSPGTELEFAL